MSGHEAVSNNALGIPDGGRAVEGDDSASGPARTVWPLPDAARAVAEPVFGKRRLAVVAAAWARRARSGQQGPAPQDVCEVS